jgi:hypothetical protein
MCQRFALCFFFFFFFFLGVGTCIDPYILATEGDFTRNSLGNY